MNKVKVYVWHGMDWNYYGGTYIAVATSVTEARRAIMDYWKKERNFGDDELKTVNGDIAGKPEVHNPPIGFMEGHGD